MNAPAAVMATLRLSHLPHLLLAAAMLSGAAAPAWSDSGRSMPRAVPPDYALFMALEARDTFGRLAAGSRVPRIVAGLAALRDAMTARAGRRSVPQIFIAGTHVGGCDDLHALEHDGKLDPMLA